AQGRPRGAAAWTWRTLERFVAGLTGALERLRQDDGGGGTTDQAELIEGVRRWLRGWIDNWEQKAPAPEDQAPDQPEAAAWPPAARWADEEGRAPGTAGEQATDLVFALAPLDEPFVFQPEGREGLYGLLAGALLVGGAQALERLRQDDDETATGAGRGRGR